MAADRTELGRAQAALVRALVADGEAPPGFDPERLRAARESLSRKRTREFTRAWPSLAREIAREVPRVDEQGGDERAGDERAGDERAGDEPKASDVAVREGCGDEVTGAVPGISLMQASGLLAGYALARARLARAELGPAAFRELCAFELRWRVTNGAVTPRRGPALRLWRRRGPTPGSRWVIALKTPWGAERWWSLDRDRG